MLRITKAEVGKRALGRAQGVVKLVRGNRVVSHRRRPRKSCLGRRPKPNGSETNDAKPAEVRLSSSALGLCCRPPLTMETSKMLPMEPVAAAALTRALSRQSSRIFITLDSQQGSPFSDSMTLCCSWR
jgi:hypothetical protein